MDHVVVDFLSIYPDVREVKKDIKIAKSKEIEAFIKLFKKSKYIQEWDERIFNFTLEKAVVHKDKSITFIFLSGIEIKVEAGE